MCLGGGGSSPAPQPLPDPNVQRAEGDDPETNRIKDRNKEDKRTALGLVAKEPETPLGRIE